VSLVWGNDTILRERNDIQDENVWYVNVLNAIHQIISRAIK